MSETVMWLALIFVLPACVYVIARMIFAAYFNAKRDFHDKGDKGNGLRKKQEG